MKQSRKRTSIGSPGELNHLAQSHEVSAHKRTDLSGELEANPHLALLLADKPLAFHRVYLLLMGDTREAVRNAYVLSKLVELEQGLNPSTGGWFTLTTEGWNNFLDMSYGHHYAARKALTQMGYLEHIMSGFPAESFYRLNIENITQSIIQLGTQYREQQLHASQQVTKH